MEIGTRQSFRGKQDQAIISVPFVGPSGRLLRRILKWANIEEGDYIFSNSVCFRPTKPGRSGRLSNRTPTD